MTGLLNYSSCAKRLGMERIILPLVDYVKHCVNSYPQSYPHNFVMIATDTRVIHSFIHRLRIDRASFPLHAKKKATLLTTLEDGGLNGLYAVKNRTWLATRTAPDNTECVPKQYELTDRTAIVLYMKTILWRK